MVGAAGPSDLAFGNNVAGPSGVPVAVIDAVPAYRLGVMAGVALAGFAPEDPDDVLDWAAREGHRGVLLTVVTPDDYRTVGELRARSRDLLIVALLADCRPGSYLRALQAGATAAVARDAHPELMARALQAALERYSLMPFEATQALVASGPEGVVLNSDAVAPHEADWLQLLAHGATVADLAQKVGYSQREMYRVLNGLYQRMGVENRVRALVRAARCGLVQ